MQLALSIMGRIRDTYGDELPEGTARASHWLGLAGPQIASYADNLDREARAFLQKQHNVDWGAVDFPVANPSVSLKIASDVQPHIAPGGKLSIVWNIENKDKQRLERVSLFVRSDAPGLDTKEVLIGGVDGSSTKTGTVEIPIPSVWDPGPLLLRVGVAVDAWPVPSAGADYLVQVVPRPIAELSAEIALGGEVGGQVAGKLEKNEKAILKVTLHNKGAVAASDLSLRVMNLAGGQVQIGDAPVMVGRLDAGESRQVSVNLQGGKALYSKELALGLYVEGEELRSPMRQRVVVKGVVSAEVTGAAKISNLSGH
jgi:hypothetical protein